MAEENKNPYDLVDQNNTTEKKDNSQKESGVFLKKLVVNIIIRFFLLFLISFNS